MALDRNGNGQIDNGLELFGTAGGATDGFAALRALDTNGDGMITAADAQFANLRVWVNPEADAIVHPGELHTLASLGIVSINLNATASTQVIGGDPIKLVSSYTLADGTTRTIGDAWLTTDPTYTKPVSTPTIPANIAVLPQLNSYGRLYDLQSAATKDSALASELQTLVAGKGTPTAAAFASVSTLLLEWSNSTAVSATSRGGLFDARQLDFIEKYTGVPFSDASYGVSAVDSANPRWRSAMSLREAWSTVEDSTGARLILQAGYSLPEFVYNSSIDAVLPNQSIAQSISSLYGRLGDITASNASSWEAALRVADAARIDEADSASDFLSTVASASSDTVAAFAGSIITGMTFTPGSTGAAITGVAENSTFYAGAGVRSIALQGVSSLQPPSLNDAIRYKAGDGILEITVSDYADAPNNSLIVTGVASAQLHTALDASGNLIVTDGVAGDSIKIDGEGGAGSNGVQSIRLDDGTVLTRAQLAGVGITGTSGADTLTESSGIGVFDGKGAPAGQTDVEKGYGGADTFIYNAGYGALEIRESGPSASVLRLGGIAQSALHVTSDGTNVLIADGTTGDAIKLDSYLSSGSGPAFVQFGDGSQLTKAQLIALETIGTSGADKLYGTSGAETFDGRGAPSGQQDYVSGGGGGDTFVYNQGYGALEIYETDFGANPANTLKLGAGINQANLKITSTGSNLILTDGITGDAVTIDSALNGSYYGVQTVSFADGSSLSKSQLIALETTGSAGADKLYGTSTAETFDGKGAPAGQQDYVSGGGGGDTFIYNKGYGAFEVYEIDYGSTPSNTLQLGTGITAGGLKVTGDSSGNLTLSDGTTGDTIKLDGELGSAAYGVQKLSFADGTSLTKTQLIALETAGSAGAADTLYGSAAAETFDGKGAPSGKQDYEQGGGGGDTFIYNKGYGALEIYETDFGANPANTLKLGAGIAQANLRVTSTGSNLVLADGTTGDTVTIDNALSGTYYGVQTLSFADGTSLSKAQLIALETTGSAGADKLYGTSGAETLDGKGAPAGQQDYVSGGGGGDTLIYNSGYGALEIYEADFGANPANTLKLGAGITQANLRVTSTGSNLILADGTTGDAITIDNALSGSYYGVQTVSFADGSSLSKAQLIALETTGSATVADLLYGTAGADTLDGKGAPAGKQDYVSGGGGGDTFVYNQGYGALELYETDFGANPANTLKLGTGITQANLRVTSTGSNLVLTDGTTGDAVTIDSALSGSYYGVQTVSFADGSSLSKAQLVALATTGTTGADKLYGTPNAETFDGKGAPAGSSDYISGGGGNDTFIYNKGYGALEISQSGSATDTSVLKLGSGITQAGLKVTDTSSSLMLSDGTAGDTITLDNVLYGSGYGPQSVSFADGTSLTRAALIALATTGTPGADKLYGTSGTETFDAKGAPVGQSDYISGGGGNDTFIYNKGYGALEISQSGSATDTSVLKLGSGITQASLKVTDTSSSLLLSDGTAGDTITLDNVLYGSGYGPQSVSFADGTSLTRAALIALATTGTPGADRLYGTSGADIFDGKGAPAGSSDYVSGGGGNDTFIYNQGYGALEISQSGSATDASVLKLGSGITQANLSVASTSSSLILGDGIAGDTITLDYVLYGSGYGPQSVSFADGTSLTRAALIARATTGTTGADRLYGSPGAETFDGKGAPAGQSDYVSGSGGNDTFIYNQGYGSLEINENGYAADASVLQLGTGITQAALKTLADASGNLILTDGTSGDTIKLDSYLNASYYGPQKLAFADGTSLTRTALINLYITQQLGAGTNTLYGPMGATTYTVNSLPGTDTIIEPYDSTYSDTLIFGSGLTESSIKLTRSIASPNDVKIGFTGQTGTLTLKGEFSTSGTANGYGVEQIAFPDGTTWNRSQILAQVPSPMQPMLLDPGRFRGRKWGKRL